MSNLSQPWVNHFFLDTTLNDSTSGAPHDGLAKAVDFVGPMMLGLLVWEIISIDVSSMLAFSTDLLFQRRAINHQTGRLAMTIYSLSAISRMSALACISIFVVYTQGKEASDCNVWPLVLIALGALSYSLAMGAALLRCLAFTSWTRWITLVVLYIVALVVTFGCIATWHGVQSQSDKSCSLEVHSTFGIFYLGPLTILLLTPIALMNASPKSQSDISSNSNKKSSDSKQDADNNPKAKQSTSHGVYITLLRRFTTGDPSQPVSTRIVDRSMSATAVRDSVEKRLNRCKAYDDVNCDHYDLLRHFLAWWFALLVVMLIGCILAFSQISIYWILTYYPISIVLCVLFMARICHPIQHHRSIIDGITFDRVILPNEQSRHIENGIRVTRPPRSASNGRTAAEAARASSQLSRRSQQSVQMTRRDRQQGCNLKDRMSQIAQDGNTSRITEEPNEKQSSPSSLNIKPASKGNPLLSTLETFAKSTSTKPREDEPSNDLRESSASFEDELLGNGILDLIVSGQDIACKPAPDDGRSQIAPRAFHPANQRRRSYYGPTLAPPPSGLTPMSRDMSRQALDCEQSRRAQR